MSRDTHNTCRCGNPVGSFDVYEADCVGVSSTGWISEQIYLTCGDELQYLK
jgi:hypothetical protein